MYFWPKVFLLVVPVILPVEQNKDPTPYTPLTLFNEEGGNVWTPTHVDNFPTLLFWIAKVVCFQNPKLQEEKCHMEFCSKMSKMSISVAKTGDLIMWSIHPHVVW
jgi:hypothetical protein